MIKGECRKILRNKVFIVMVTAIFAANIVCILYCAETRNDYYYEAKQQEQQQYIQTYQSYLDGIESRSQDVLEALNNDHSLFLRRSVDKTRRDYSGLSPFGLDTTYNVGVEEYAGYNYGIFFCIIFSFVCLEYLYLFEKRTGCIHILRTTKNGRIQMILCKWCVYLLLVLLFAAAQELTTVFLYSRIYSLGNLDAPLQSLPMFRDCPIPCKMWEGIGVSILNRIFISIAVGSIIFFFGTVCGSIVKSLMIPCAFFSVEYILSITVSIDSSQAALCGMNLFYSWNIKNFLGVYHHLNFFDYPAEKNAAVSAMNVITLICCAAVGSVIFAVRHQEGYQKHEFFLLKWLRQGLSKVLHLKSIFINELYKLLFQQKKLILPAVFLLVFIGSVDSYLPSSMYQTGEEAYYHLYLSNLEGAVDKDSDQYISNEQSNIATLEENLDQAMEAGDEGSAMVLSMELAFRRSAFERLTAQNDKMKAHSNVQGYWIDEMNLNKMIKKYDRDVLLFMASAVVLILLVSGLFASEKENRIFHLIYSTKNGREKLLRSKLMCSIFLSILLFTLTQLPSWIGYVHILPAECLSQRLDLLYEPALSSGMTLLCLLMLIYFLKLLLYATIVSLTILMARRTKNEFITSVFMSTVVIIVCLVMYFLKTNLSTIVISLM